MRHVAIDLGKRESQICIRQPDGVIVQQHKVPTRSLPRLVRQWERSRVIMETSSEAFKIADAARSAGHEVRVVAATLVKQLGVGARGIKTDRRDAQVLSQVSCRIDLPSVHIPSEASRILKSTCGNREELIECRTKLVNNVRGWLRTQLWQVKPGSPSTFPARVRVHAATINESLPEHIERTLPLIEELTKQIGVATKQLSQIAKTDAVCSMLMSAPGIGPITAVRFMAAIDDPKRFRNAHAVQSYLGLTPGEMSSADEKRRTAITKAGPRAVRRVLVQAAWCAMRMSSRIATDPMLAWANALAQRKHKFTAVVALARKLAGILFAMWRDNTSYTTRPASS